MSTTIIFEEQVEMPTNLQSLDDFRRWTHSDDFPDRGRIDFVAGRIEVDMSPEDLFTHGSPKSEIHGILHSLVKRNNRGFLFVDRARVVCQSADLSAEPDIVFISTESIADGRVRLVPKAGGAAGRYTELDGAPDLIVEIVSDSSTAKDYQRLPSAFFRAGVKEYWLVDARADEIVFKIHQRGSTGFEPSVDDEDDYQSSDVFDCRFRLARRRDDNGLWQYDLETQS